MLEKMIFGRYIPGNSFVHKIDPRSKLIFVFLFIIVVFLANNCGNIRHFVWVYVVCYFHVANSTVFS